MCNWKIGSTIGNHDQNDEFEILFEDSTQKSISQSSFHSEGGLIKEVYLYI